MNSEEKELKIAYICLCHIEPEIVARAAKALQYKNDGFFVHVDNKTDIAPFEKACEGISSVSFVHDRIDNFWGGFNSVTATIKTIKLAMETDKYDRFVLLQGQDYPLFSPKEIHSFFEENKTVEFCRGWDITVSPVKKDYMRCYGFWIQDVNVRKPWCKFLRGFMARINKLGIKYRKGVFKNGEENWHIYRGWAQFALTSECIEHIVKVYDENKSYNKYMKHRFPPDEIYFHTIVQNSPFKNNVWDKVIVRRSGEKTYLNLTYFEYPVYVTVFKEKSDLEWLRETGCLFVRKVNSSSKALIDEIDKRIAGK